MAIPVEKLKNAALDYAVGLTVGKIKEGDKSFVNDGYLMVWDGAQVFSPSQLWSDIGVVIDALSSSPNSSKITVGKLSEDDSGEVWAAYAHGKKVQASGCGFKDAVCRLYLLCQDITSFEVPHSIASKA